MANPRDIAGNAEEAEMVCIAEGFAFLPGSGREELFVHAKGTHPSVRFGWLSFLPLLFVPTNTGT